SSLSFASCFCCLFLSIASFCLCFRYSSSSFPSSSSSSSSAIFGAPKRLFFRIRKTPTFKCSSSSLSISSSDETGLSGGVEDGEDAGDFCGDEGTLRAKMDEATPIFRRKKIKQKNLFGLFLFF